MPPGPLLCHPGAVDPARDIQSISSISTLLAALTFVLGGAVVLSGRRRKAYLAFIGLCANLFFWHLLSIFRGYPRLSYLAVGVLCIVPVSLLAFLRTWLGENRALDSGILFGVPRGVWLLLGAGEAAVLYAYGQRDVPGRPYWTAAPSVLQAMTLLGLYGALSPLWRAHPRSVSPVRKRPPPYLPARGALTLPVAAGGLLPPPQKPRSPPRSHRPPRARFRGGGGLTPPRAGGPATRPGPWGGGRKVGVPDEAARPPLGEPPPRKLAPPYRGGG